MINKNDIIRNVKQNIKIVEKFLGYTKRKVPPIISKKILEEMNKFSDYIDIEYEYKIFEKEKYAQVIYTIGHKLDDVIKDYVDKGEGMRALIMDKIGIVTLDEIKNSIKNEISCIYGLKVKKENYPGNIKFPLSTQKNILDNMKNIKKITINDYFQLFPIKSVALIFELSEKEEFYNFCEECQNICEGFKKTEEEMYKFFLKKAEEYTKKLYMKENFSKKIYLDNIKDIEIWSNKYEEKYGLKGLEKKHFKWIDDILEMKVLKLGRLQFELLEIEKEDEQIKKLVKSLENFILVNVHIREDEKLIYEDCEKSYLNAKKYYKLKGLKFDKIVFICYSWLINPNLQKVLSYDSNIIKFQKKYNFLHLDENDKNSQIIERVFNNINFEELKNFSPTTELQKKLKNLLEKDNEFSMAKGYFIMNVN